MNRRNNMLICIFAILLLAIKEANCAGLNANLTAEQSLLTSLFASAAYNSKVRPDNTVTVQITIAMKQITQLDEKNQIMTSSLYFSQQWTDQRLTWVPASNQNVEVIMAPIKSLWLPDTYILNSADADGYLKLNSDFSLASVRYTGEIYVVLPSTGIKTRCPLNTKNYPFDTQSCDIILTSWANPINRIVIDSTPNYVADFNEYVENPIWQFSGSKVIESPGGDRVIFEDSSNQQVALRIFLTRKPLYYMMNSVFPCFILNLVTILTFFMPMGNALGLCMTGFMTFAVYSLRISTDMPVQSDFLPKISVYFICSISINLAVMFWYLYVFYYTNRPENFPAYMDKIATGLKKVFCWCYPPDNKTKPENKDKGKDQITVDITDNKDQITKIDIPDSANGVALPATVDLKKEDKKPKCNFCDRCEACEADFKKDKDKGKTKKDVTIKLEALNYFVLILTLLTIFTYNMAIWLSYYS